MLNNLIWLDKVATWGLSAAHDEIYTNIDKNLISNDNEILCYVYFTDIVDIRYIEINSEESKPIVIKLWNYNMDVDFDSLYEDIRKDVSTNNKILLTKFDFTTDYFTLIISDLHTIKNITFYGNKNKRHTRRVDEIRLVWGGGNCNDTKNDIKADKKMPSIN